MFLRVLLLLVLTVASASAQFYAPNTDFHTPAERLFPVELARVLASVRNRMGGAEIAEIRFQLRAPSPQSTEWQLQWLDSRGTVVRERKVAYPQASLTNGAEWYRLVAGQIVGDDWAISPAGNANAALHGFWTGASNAGLSRIEGVRKAAEFVERNSALTGAPEAAQLAGYLAGSTTPSVASTTMLDALLLARSAAWLAIAEQAGRNRLDEAWSAILLRTNRVPAARAIWPKPATHAADLESPYAARRYHAIRLGTLPLREYLAFAGAPRNRDFAMPLLIELALYDKDRVNLLRRVAPKLFDSATFSRLYDYGPTVTVRGNVDAGILVASSPNDSMRAVAKTLEAWKPSSLDYADYRKSLPNLSEEKPGYEDGLIPVIGPMVRHAREQGCAGALIPVSVATTRDLLFYTWESAGLQYGYRHNYLRVMLGHAPSAATLAAVCFKHFSEIDGYFQHLLVQPEQPLSDVALLQYSNSSAVLSRLTDQPPAAWANNPAALLQKRWTLEGGGNREVEAMIAAGVSNEAIAQFVKRLIAEGGPMAFNYLVAEEKGAIAGKKMKELGLRETLVPLVPYATWLELERIQKEFARQPLRLAQEMEKLEWSNGSITQSSIVFRGYIDANAIDAAKRYYAQANGNVPIVELSGGMGQRRFGLALYEKDFDAMAQVLKRVSSHSQADYRMQTTYAVIKGEYGAAQELIEQTNKRYTRSEADTQFIAYLPLIPALKDPSHAKHREAVSSFPRGPRSSHLQVIQWWLLQDAKLPLKEAIEFLGGDTPEVWNQFFIDYLRGDVEGFDRSFSAAREFVYRDGYVLGAMLGHELRKTPRVTNLPDLRPADYASLESVVLAAARGQ